MNILVYFLGALFLIVPEITILQNQVDKITFKISQLYDKKVHKKSKEIFGINNCALIVTGILMQGVKFISQCLKINKTIRYEQTSKL